MNILDYRYMTPKFRSEINYLRLPVNIFGFNDQDVEDFNSIVKYWESKYDNWHDIVRTASGGISTKRGILKMPAWDFIVQNAYIELTVLTDEICARYQVSINKVAVDEVGRKIGGRQAFNTFVSVCKKHNIDITQLAIDNGEEVKQEIASPIIKCLNHKNLYREFENVHHIDLNSSYMSGIAQAYPVLKPAIQEIFDRRKDIEVNKLYKAVLNCSYGYFQSKYCNIGGHKFALAHLSKAAREFNDNYINDLIDRLKSTGRVVLMVNTDGIWYYGEVFHDADEGTGLGQWKNDHVNCKFRMKSDGAYEYIEDGQYCPVVRGSTRLDKILDRKEWQWGDIFKYDASIINTYGFDKKTRQIIKTEVLV